MIYTGIILHNFYCIFNQINAALESIKESFTNNNKKSYRTQTRVCAYTLSPLFNSMVYIFSVTQWKKNILTVCIKSHMINNTHFTQVLLFTQKWNERLVCFVVTLCSFFLWSTNTHEVCVFMLLERRYFLLILFCFELHTLIWVHLLCCVVLCC